MPTLRENLAQAAAALERASIPAPRLTAEALLAHVLGCERSYFYAHPEAVLEPAAQTRFEHLLRLRAEHIPLQHLTGVQEFYGRSFAVSPAALIPRPETELVVEAALDLLARDTGVAVADIGTGSGCIAVTLALERPRAAVTATDVSRTALSLAQANARRLGARVMLVETDLLAGIAGPLDLIVSNPPYLAQAELAELAPEVRDHEPEPALVAGPLGTEVYARLIEQAEARLRPGGGLVLELGFASAAAVRALLDRPSGAGSWQSIATRRDLQGWERVLIARRRLF